MHYVCVSSQVIAGVRRQFPGCQSSVCRDVCRRSLPPHRQRTRRITIARVRQLPAASVLRSHDGSITVRRYWDLAEAPDHTANEKELAAQYRDLLLDAVSRRFAAAKSPAFTLSGGLDSSSVLSCAVARSGAKQHAYSSVYTDLTYDETA